MPNHSAHLYVLARYAPGREVELRRMPLPPRLWAVSLRHALGGVALLFFSAIFLLPFFTSSGSASSSGLLVRVVLLAAYLALLVLCASAFRQGSWPILALLLCAPRRVRFTYGERTRAGFGFWREIVLRPSDVSAFGLRRRSAQALQLRGEARVVEWLEIQARTKGGRGYTCFVSRYHEHWPGETAVGWEATVRETRRMAEQLARIAGARQLPVEDLEKGLPSGPGSGRPGEEPGKLA